jgi:predicted amidophosphoribosyltransferase
MTISNQITLDSALSDQAPLDFDPPRRTPELTVQIVCRVCWHAARITLSTAGLLCADCRADLDKTALHIAETLALAEQAFERAVLRCDAAFGQAEENDQRRYQAALERRETLPAATFTALWDKAKATGDGLSAILLAKDASDAAAENVMRVRIWAACATEEVEAARC